MNTSDRNSVFVSNPIRFIKKTETHHRPENGKKPSKEKKRQDLKKRNDAINQKKTYVSKKNTTP